MIKSDTLAHRRTISLYPLVGVVLIMVLWVTASRLGWAGKTLLASPFEVYDVLRHAAAPGATPDQQVFRHLLATVGRASQGWAIALSFGTLIGLVLGGHHKTYLAGEPIMEFARSVPPILALPLLLVKFGYRDEAHVWAIVFGCLPLITLTVARGTQSVSRSSAEKFDLLRTFGVKKGVRLMVRAIEVLPAILLSARLSLSIALIVAVVTEMVSAPRSGWALGVLARDAETAYQTPVFYACVVAIGAFGYAMNVVLRKLEKMMSMETTA